MTWNTWSDWAASQKWKREKEWPQLVQAALDPREKFSILPRGGSWQIKAMRHGVVMSEHKCFEDARVQCQKMGWRYL